MSQFMFELVNKELDPFLNKLFEGGAFGHLAHPFEDLDMTFGQLKKMVESILSGKIDAYEKIDGQQLSFSWKNGKLIGARNKSQLKEFGKNSLTPEQMSDFIGRNANVPKTVVNAFYSAMTDLQNAMTKIPESVLKNMFQEGKRFMNTELVAEETANIIPYYKDYLVFHGLIEYDINGTPIKHIDGSGKQLEDAVNQVGQSNQSKFQIKGPNNIVLKNFKELPMERDEIFRELKKLQRSVPDNSTVLEQIEDWWKTFILRSSKEMEYEIPGHVFDMLVGRWGRQEKRVNTIPKIISQINHDTFKNWVIDYDKNKYDSQYSDLIKPYELFFLKLGASVLFNASGYLSASPIKTVSDLSKLIQRDALKIKQSKDLDDVKKLKHELERLEKIGRHKLIGSEGVVFSMNDKLYKLTGVFAPVNQILSILKYKKLSPDVAPIKTEGESSLNLLDSPQNPIDRPLATTEINELIREGGNVVFTNSTLDSKYLKPTITNALKMWGLRKLNYEIVGSKNKSIMNDVDVAIDSDELAKLVGVNLQDKDVFWNAVESYLKPRTPKRIPSPALKINRGLDQIHISAPIVGLDHKFIQIDLMLGDVGWMKDALSGAVDSKYKALYRNLLLVNILSYSHESTKNPNILKKYQINWKRGLQSVDLINNLGKIEKSVPVTLYNNMDDVALFLFGSGVTFNDISTFEKLFKLLDSPSFRYKDKKDEIIDSFNKDIIRMKLTPIK